MSKQLTPSERNTLAGVLGVNPAYLYQCLTGRRDMNPAEALRLETQSGALITRQQLCQKTWHGIWPELPAAPANTAKAATQYVAVGVA